MRDTHRPCLPPICVMTLTGPACHQSLCLHTHDLLAANLCVYTHRLCLPPICVFTHTGPACRQSRTLFLKLRIPNFHAGLRILTPVTRNHFSASSHRLFSVSLLSTSLPVRLFSPHSPYSGIVSFEQSAKENTGTLRLKLCIPISHASSQLTRPH